jgi:hypothetical protein
MTPNSMLASIVVLAVGAVLAFWVESHDSKAEKSP